MKKSQITIFIVLGLVVMIIFGLLYFVRNSTSDIILEKRINKIYGDFLSSTGIKDYVSACLDRSTKDAIKLAALQGGKIYDYQIDGGYNITYLNDVVPFNHSGYVYNVSYGIKAPTPGFGQNLDVPYYPYSGKLVSSSPIKSPFVNYSYLSYPYTLTPLCNGYGPNYFNISNATYSCEVWDQVYNQSMQEYIELFIEQKLSLCVNFPKFIEKTSYDISEGDITAFVLIGDFDIFVVVDYPIIINIEDKPPSTRFLEFSKRLDIRLKKIHELAIHLIGLRSIIRSTKPETESDNIFFNITRDDPNDCRTNIGSYSFDELCTLTGMSVNKIKDYCLNHPSVDLCNILPEHYKYSDIINITDENSLIDGGPLMFLFAVENRVPALDQITSLEVGEGVEFVDCVPGALSGCDPDEDGLTYSYSTGGGITFTVMGGNKFTPASSGTYRIKVNDSEGLYDYEDISVS